MKIVVTGMGIISPVGSGVQNFWGSLCGGESGIREITRFDTSEFTFTRAGEIEKFRLPEELEQNSDTADISTQLMMTAALEAMKDSGLTGMERQREDIGVVLSTNFGGIVSGEAHLAHVSGKGNGTGRGFSEYSFQRCADQVADRWNLAGPRVVLSLSCASGTAALGYGMGLIRSGRAKAVLTGGYDALSRFAWSGLSALRTMTKDQLRPFDKNRNGTLFSEGAGALIIEEFESAQERGAGIYAEIAGYGLNNNAHHMTAPAKEGEGSAAVMRMALTDAGMSPEKVDHINTHGTGTKYNDIAETKAIKSVFGDHACRMPITSIKSMTGHMMGAAGSAEAIASIMSIRHGIIPPTINFKEPDPECDLDCVTNISRKTNINTVLSNSAGIGGCNAAVIFASATQSATQRGKRKEEF